MGLRTVGLTLTLVLAILSVPLATEAQQPGKVPRIGYLTLRSGPTERE